MQPKLRSHCNMYGRSTCKHRTMAHAKHKAREQYRKDTKHSISNPEPEAILKGRAVRKKPAFQGRLCSFLRQLIFLKREPLDRCKGREKGVVSLTARFIYVETNLSCGQRTCVGFVRREPAICRCPKKLMQLFGIHIL